MTPGTQARLALRIDVQLSLTQGFKGKSVGIGMRAWAGIACALLVVAVAAPDGARAAAGGTSQEIWLTGAAYGFSAGPRLTERTFRLNTSTIRFKMALDYQVWGWLEASQKSGGFVAVRIDPTKGVFEGMSTDPTFVAERIAIKGALRNVNPGGDLPLFGPRPQPIPASVRALAEAIVLRETGRTDAANVFLDTALADAALRPALRAVALRTRGQIEETADPDSDEAPTTEGDRALIKALADLDRAVALEPEDADSANARSHVLARLGAYDEAVEGLRPSPDIFRDYVRYGWASQWHRWLGDDAGALADMDEMAKRYPSGGGMAFHFNRGEALLGLGRLPAAINEFTQGLAAQADFMPAIVGRACAYARLGRLEDARMDLDKVSALAAAASKNRAYLSADDDAKWLDNARTKLGEAISRNPHVADDSPCRAEHPRSRSPLLAERAVAAKGPTPVP